MSIALPTLRELLPAEIRCCTCEECRTSVRVAQCWAPVQAEELVLPPIRDSPPPGPLVRRTVKRFACRQATPPVIVHDASTAPEPCFDVFRCDIQSDSLVHIASSTTRWTGIPLLPLPRTQVGLSSAATSPESSPTTTTFGALDLENAAAAEAQREFETQVMKERRTLRPATPLSDDEEDNRALTHRHICPCCQKRFNRPSSLVAHGRTHTGFKPFVCPYPACGRGFSVHSNMRRHYNTHLSKSDGDRWETTPDSLL